MSLIERLIGFLILVGATLTFVFSALSVFSNTNPFSIVSILFFCLIWTLTIKVSYQIFRGQVYSKAIIFGVLFFQVPIIITESLVFYANGTFAMVQLFVNLMSGDYVIALRPFMGVAMLFNNVVEVELSYGVNVVPLVIAVILFFTQRRNRLSASLEVSSK